MAATGQKQPVASQVPPLLPLFVVDAQIVQVAVVRCPVILFVIEEAN